MTEGVHAEARSEDMRDAVRTCLQIAGGLTEATRRRAVGAARGLLDQAGVDVAALQRSIGERIPPEVQSLADELIASGKANRDMLLGLIREEVDKTMGRVGRLADEITKVGIILEALERRVRNLEGPTEPEPPREHVPVADDIATPPAAKRTPPAAKKPTPAAEKPAPAAKKTAPAAKKTAPAAKKTAPAAKKSTAAAKKAAPAAKKTVPAAEKTAPAAKKSAPAAKKSAAGAKKSAGGAKKASPGAKKTAAKKTTPAAKKSASAAKKSAPAAKKTASAAPEATPAKKTTPRKPAGDE
jgi:hypothetical protein